MMKQHNKGHIAFVSIDDGGERSSSSCSKIAWALAEQGWYVDLFAHQSEPPVQGDHPRYRKIFLPISLDGDIDKTLDALEAATQAFLRYQETQGVLYPIVHTHCWASAWIGARIKQHQLIRSVHTSSSPSLLSEFESASGRHPAAIERQCLGSVDCLIVPSLTAEEIPRANGCSLDGVAASASVPASGIISASKIHSLSHQRALVDQLDDIYREQLDLLCRQFFFASPLPETSQRAAV